MAPNPSLQKHTLNLRRGDFDYIDSLFTSEGVAASIVIRKIVSRFVDQHRSQESQPDFSLEDLQNEQP